MLDGNRVGRFRKSGFVIMPGTFDPQPLSDEIDRSLTDGLLAPTEAYIRFADVAVRYLPMMSERTPVSLSLLDTLAGIAAQLLGRVVLPMRAKGSRYFGNSGWHTDSDLEVPSVGLVAYLESLDAGSGALRVQPGSHRREATARADSTPVQGSSAHTEALPTVPGDVIAFDEHLAHGSSGGKVRRQWRVDFVADPVDDHEEALVRSYFARLYPLDWDGRYDVNRYPNYDGRWRTWDRPWTERLRELGVYDLADAHEDALRVRHLTS